MKRRWNCLTLICLAFAGIPSIAQASYITGEWSNPAPIGHFITLSSDLASANIEPLSDNSATAVYDISTTNTPNDTISQGTCLDPPYPVCQTTVTFTGASSIPSDPTTPFQIGTIAYTNGSSLAESQIFGATLSFYKVTGATRELIGKDLVSLAITLPGDTPEQNADYISLDGLAGLSFGVYEQKTGYAGLDGKIVGDPVLTLTGLTYLSGAGFIANSPFIPFGVSEPGTASLLGGALAVIGLISVLLSRGRSRALATLVAQPSALLAPGDARPGPGRLPEWISPRIG